MNKNQFFHVGYDVWISRNLGWHDVDALLDCYKVSRFALLKLKIKRQFSNLKVFLCNLCFMLDPSGSNLDRVELKDDRKIE